MDKLTEYINNKKLSLFESQKPEDNIKAMGKFLCSDCEAVEIRLFQLPSLKPFKYKNGSMGYKNTYSVYTDNETDFIKLAGAMEAIAEHRKVLEDDPQPNKQATVCFSLQGIDPKTAKERIEQTKKEGMEDLRKLFKGEYNSLRDIKQCSSRDIVKRKHLVIDLDPERESGIPSTEDEKDKARELAIEVLEFLKWEIPLIVDSGNGIHLIFCVDMPENKENRKLIDDFYAGLGNKLTNQFVKIDSSLGDSSRCLKLAGTKNRKGIKPTTERPHRFSYIVYMPEVKKLITIDEIKKIAELAPKKKINTDYIQEYNQKTIPTEKSILFKRNRQKAEDEILKKIGIISDGEGRFEAMKKACSIAVSYLGLTDEALKVVLKWNSNNRPPKEEKAITDYFNGFMKQRYNVLPIGAKAETFIEDRNRITIKPYSTLKLEFGGNQIHNKIADFLGIRQLKDCYFIPCFDVMGNISYIRYFDTKMVYTNTLAGSNNMGVFNHSKSCCCICSNEITAYRIFKEVPELAILVLADNKREIDQKTYEYIRSCKKVFVCFLEASKDKMELLNDFYLFFDGAIAIKDSNLKEIIEKNVSKNQVVECEQVTIKPPEVKTRVDTDDTDDTIIDDNKVCEIMEKAIIKIDDSRTGKEQKDRLKELINKAGESEHKDNKLFYKTIKELIELVETDKSKDTIQREFFKS